MSFFEVTVNISYFFLVKYIDFLRPVQCFIWNNISLDDTRKIEKRGHIKMFGVMNMSFHAWTF